jgi:hypothetical protein
MKLIARFVMVASILAAFALTCPAQVFPSPEGEFHTEYDRFKDETILSLLQLQVAEKQYEGDYQRLYLSVWAQFASTRPTRRPAQIGVIFTSWSLWNNRYTEAAPLYAIIDGERKSYGPASPIKRRVINGKYVVSMGASLSADDFMQIVNAKKVEMRLGELEFSLNDHGFKMLHEFSHRVNPVVSFLSSKRSRASLSILVVSTLKRAAIFPPSPRELRIA